MIQPQKELDKTKTETAQTLTAGAKQIAIRLGLLLAPGILVFGSDFIGLLDGRAQTSLALAYTYPFLIAGWLVYIVVETIWFHIVKRTASRNCNLWLLAFVSSVIYFLATRR